MESSSEILNKLGPERVKVGESMRLHTYMRVGGPAEFYFEAQNSAELEKAVQAALELQIPYVVIGQGANVLVSDKGIKGLVIKNSSKEIKFLPHDFVEVDSGVNIIDLGREIAKRGLGGLERMTRVPASVGGAVFMNAGDTGKNEFFGDLVVAITAIDKQGKTKKIFKEEADFTYRTSRFQNSGEIILSVKLQLPKRSQAQVDEKIADILQRKQKHPAGPSVGSTFRNPEGAHAGDLIEKALLKGTSVGGAKISEQHANFIINTGSARAADIKQLIDLMKSQVKEKFDVNLVEEVRYLGEW
ncbi:MAG TPA: UDP-N-acetylmuramate dehydrogenase [Candidatus Saccharimonadales bacterium]|nr:UDP-N-acetylmuramate dehydrogenase [Candidatus Saccharimonadales bacterium]